VINLTIPIKNTNREVSKLGLLDTEEMRSGVQEEGLNDLSILHPFVRRVVSISGVSWLKCHQKSFFFFDEPLEKQLPDRHQSQPD
jgi:hypothetical protein